MRFWRARTIPQHKTNNRVTKKHIEVNNTYTFAESFLDVVSLADVSVNFTNIRHGFLISFFQKKNVCQCNISVSIRTGVFT